MRFWAADFSDGCLGDGHILHLDAHEVARNILAAQEARQAGVRVLLDAEALRPRVDELLRVCDIVLANAGFARRLTGKTAPQTQLEALRRHTHASIVGITLGAARSMAWSEGQVVAAPAYRIDVKDTTGAGDIYHGAFSYGLLRQWPLDQICRFANAVSALSCRGLGGRAMLPRLSKVEALMGESLDDAPEVPRGALPDGALVDQSWDFAREAHRAKRGMRAHPTFTIPATWHAAWWRTLA